MGVWHTYSVCVLYLNSVYHKHYGSKFEFAVNRLRKKQFITNIKDLKIDNLENVLKNTFKKRYLFQTRTMGSNPYPNNDDVRQITSQWQLNDKMNFR